MGSGKDSPLLSLRDTCTRQLLEKILENPSAGLEFVSLEPRVQRLVFDQLSTQQGRLREADKQWTELTRKSPHADTVVILNEPRGLPSDDDYSTMLPDMRSHQGIWHYYEETDDGPFATYEDIEPEDISEVIGFPVPHGFHQEASDVVGNLDQDSDIPNQEARDGESVIQEPVEYTRWSHKQLFSRSLESQLELCHHEFAVNCATCRPEGSFRFRERVSSQLLLYRLSLVFGMPPRPDESVVFPTLRCWETDLQHSDGTSTLRLEDYTGRPRVWSHGTVQASADALVLLSFLTGPDCKYIDDSINLFDLDPLLQARSNE